MIDNDWHKREIPTLRLTGLCNGSPSGSLYVNLHLSPTLDRFSLPPNGTEHWRSAATRVDLHMMCIQWVSENLLIGQSALYVDSMPVGQAQPWCINAGKWESEGPCGVLHWLPRTAMYDHADPQKAQELLQYSLVFERVRPT